MNYARRDQFQQKLKRDQFQQQAKQNSKDQQINLQWWNSKKQLKCFPLTD